MASLKQQAIAILARLEKWFDDFRLWLVRILRLKANSHLRIECYRGYGRRDHLVLSGRVLKYKPLYASSGQSKWRNFIDTYRRFGTDEVPGARLQATIGANTFQVETDEEGYFLIDSQLPVPLSETPEKSLRMAGDINLLEAPWGTTNENSKFEVLIPASNARMGIISDIDDTILHTHVTSLLKLKTLYFTIFHNAFTRKAFQEVEAFFQALHRSSGDQPVNPFFYVSNSPWNLYDLLADFLSINDLPTGPILLRDIGLPNEPIRQKHGHKYATITRILNIYPQLPFLLIGDSSEKDADIYLEIASLYPQRIKGIFIRDVRHHKRARRIAQLVRENTHVPIFLFQNYRDAAINAAQQRWLRFEDFERLSPGKGR